MSTVAGRDASADLAGIPRPADRPAVRLATADGRALALPVERWLGDATAGERHVLAAAAGPVLDVGCGPGRHLLALNRAGVPALGIDTSPEAVAIARRRGVSALVRSVFDRLPGAGRWGTALLLDGNIGIGGDPRALLRRVRALVAPAGEIIVEVGEGSGVETLAVRIEHGRGPRSEWFPWALVGAGALAEVADAAGLRAWRRWEVEGRCFVGLRC